MITTVGCSICQDSFNDNRPSVVTKCGHVFHLGCVQEWINRNHTCPSCRTATSQADLIKVFFSPVHEDIEENVDLLNKLEQTEYQVAIFSSKCEAMEIEKEEIQGEKQSVISDFKAKKSALKKYTHQLCGRLKQMDHRNRQKIGFLNRQIEALKKANSVTFQMFQDQRKTLVETNEKAIVATKAEIEERICKLDSELQQTVEGEKNQKMENLEEGKLQLVDGDQREKRRPIRKRVLPLRYLSDLD